MVLKTRLQKASSAQAVCMAVWKAVLAVCLQDGARECGGGFLLNIFDQKLFNFTSIGYTVNHFLYSSFRSAIPCKRRRKRINET